MADFNEEFEKLTNTEDSTDAYDPADIKGNMAMAILAYISWLVLIPLLLVKNSRYVRYHCNQGLILAIIEIICCFFLASMHIFSPFMPFSLSLSLLS